MARWLVIGICVLLLCGVAAAGNITVMVDPAPDPSGFFVVGDSVRISGQNLAPDVTKIILRNNNLMLQPGYEQHFEASVIDGRWDYSFKSLPCASYSLMVMTIDGSESASSGFVIGASLPKTPTPVPTTEPTPDYSAKISQLEERIAAQETAIATLQKTQVPTIAEVTAPTPSPTATPNYEATIAAMQTRIAEQQTQIQEQDSWIDAILKFLGLK